MATFSAEMSSFTFDGKAFTEAFDKAVKELLREACRAFLKAALARIPVRTGFLAGAFRVLSEAIGDGSANFQIEKLLRQHNELLRKQREYVQTINEKVVLNKYRVEQLQTIDLKLAALEKERQRLLDVYKRARETGNEKVLASFRGSFEGVKNEQGAFVDEGEGARRLRETSQTLQSLKNLKEHGPAQLARTARNIERMTKRLEQVRQRLAKLDKKLQQKSVQVYLTASEEAVQERAKATPQKPMSFQQLPGKSRIKFETVDGKRRAVTVKEPGLSPRQQALGVLAEFRTSSREAGKRGPVELYQHTDGTFTIKTPTSGTNFAELTGYPPDGKEGIYKFRFSVNIIYLGVNDQKYGWHSWEAGVKAFNDVVNDAASKLPDVMTYMSKVTYTLDTEGRVSKRLERLAY